MHLAALVVVFSALVVEPCLAGLTVQKHDPDRSSLVEASIDILESCYAHRFSDVGLAGPAAGSIMKTMTMRNTVLSVTLVDETSVASVDPMDDANRHKLQVFAITVTDSSNLVKTLVRLKYSKWWNHMASFVLIDQSGTSHGCSKAYENLWEAWKMNLLNAKFMCVDQTRGTLIYTFNPYTNKAPIPWRQENTYKGINGHPWTLFAMQYREEESHCDELDYDKTSDLGGYPICGTIADTEWFYSPLSNLPVQYVFWRIMFKILDKSVNVTWTIATPPVDTLSPRSDHIENVTKGNCDICLDLLNSDGLGNKFCNPRSELSFYVATNYRGDKSQLEKIISVFDIGSRFGVIVVLLITLLFFKFYLRKPMMLAILDIVLITCNAGLGRIPEELAPRMYFAGLFIFVVTIQGIYSGVLATLITGNVRMRNIDSIEDLAQSDHTIYGRAALPFFFNSSAFEGRLVILNGARVRLEEQELRDPKTALVSSQFEIVESAGFLGMHMSSKAMFTLRPVYLIRPDWPLEERVNAFYARVFTTGMLDFYMNLVMVRGMNRLERAEYEYQNQPPRVITLEQLTFAFVILAIGLACATIVFIIEVAIYGEPIANPKMLMKKWYGNLLKLVFRR